MLNVHESVLINVRLVELLLPRRKTTEINQSDSAFDYLPVRIDPLNDINELSFHIGLSELL
jgi:hypothetical protein